MESKKSKEEKMLAVCNAIAHYIHTNEHKKAFYLLEKFTEPAPHPHRPTRKRTANVTGLFD